MDPLKDVKDRMGVLIQFILDNLKKPITREIQAEFNIIYNQYTKALDEVYEQHNISEAMAVKMQVKSPVEVPEYLLDDFEEWFSGRLDSMVKTNARSHGESINN